MSDDDLTPVTTDPLIAIDHRTKRIAADLKAHIEHDQKTLGEVSGQMKLMVDKMADLDKSNARAEAQLDILVSRHKAENAAEATAEAEDQTDAKKQKRAVLAKVVGGAIVTIGGAIATYLGLN